MFDMQNLIELFKKEVHDRAAEVDPDNKHDWCDLTYGWAIGKGLPLEEAKEFAYHIRYKTNLG